MSGHKCSKVRYDAERERRSQLLVQLTPLQREFAGILQDISALVSRASAGVQQHFVQEIQQAQQWVAGIQNEPALGRWSMSNSASELADGLAQMQRLVPAGRQQQAQLMQTVITRAGRLRGAVKNRLSDLDSLFTSRQALIHQWLGDASLRHLEGIREDARQLVEVDAFIKAEEQLNVFQHTLESTFTQAVQQETKHLHQEQMQKQSAARRALQACFLSLQERLESASPGLKATFADAVEQGQRWLQYAQTVMEETGQVQNEANTDRLGAAIDCLQETLHAGRAVTAALQHAFLEQAIALRTQGEEQVAALEVLHNGSQELLANWFGVQEIASARATLEHLRALLKAERLNEITAPCQVFQHAILSKLQIAEEREAQHQRRLYLLKALRQVCVDMGFAEVIPPRYEQESDLNSRIVLRINTFNHGEITFHLSLASLDADSCLSQTHCFEEFEQLSAHLAAKFGVQTKFRMAEGEPLPEIIYKGERDEPKGTDRAISTEAP